MKSIKTLFNEKKSTKLSELFKNKMKSYIGQEIGIKSEYVEFQELEHIGDKIGDNREFSIYHIKSDDKWFEIKSTPYEKTLYIKQISKQGGKREPVSYEGHWGKIG